MKTNTDWFCCLACGGNTITQTPQQWICNHCGKTYATVSDIPLLVDNWKVHEKEIENVSEIRSDWYLVEQPPEEISPWKHHLRKRRVFVQNTIEEYLQTIGKERVETSLDIGCGDGNYLRFLQNYTSRIFGSDYNITRLIRAQKQIAHATLFLADILNFPVSNNYFDIIYFNHVLEHITDDKTALDSIYKSLKPGGLLILGIPNEGVWWWKLAYKLDPSSLKSTDHVHFYTLDKIKEKVLEVGFIIKQTKYMGWGPPHWKLDMRIRKYRLVDDLFELFGKILFPAQASSIYIIATK